MNKNCYIALLVIFGFFLIPNVIFACGNHSDENSCKKEILPEQDSKYCCNTNSKDQESTGCHGKCGHSNCTISAVHVALIAPFLVEINSEILFSNLEKENFKNLKTTISDGFQSLWLIPKIG